VTEAYCVSPPVNDHKEDGAMKVEKIDHVHIYVNDLEKAKRFFSLALGTRFSDAIDIPEFDLRSVIDPLGIELIEGRTDGGYMDRLIQKRGEGLAAISLKVVDIEEAILQFKDMGLRMTGRSQFGRLKEAWFHPDDAFGVMIELCEYESVHPGEIALKDELKSEIRNVSSDINHP
jgi:predicted enzyme related to lactoylglutathione lyase